MTEKSIDDCGGAGDNVECAGKIDDKIDGKIHKIDHKTNNGVGKGDKKKGNDEVGESSLDSDDSLGIDFGP